MAASAITGTNFLGASPTGYNGANTQLTPAIQTLWSKEILNNYRGPLQVTEE